MIMAQRDNNEPTKPQQPSDVDNTTVRTQAAFVNKLYKMLEDTTIQSLISWSDRGDLFSVSNPTAFSKSVLPQYFKHNNWQSFVRQLNMYGFHKVNDMIHSNLTSDNQTWEFKHPHFKRGEIEDLQNIKRKSTKPNFSSLLSRMPSVSARVVSDNDEDIYGPMYKHILHIEDRLHYVSRSYEILKNETNTLKSLLTRQQETISEFALLLGDVLEEDVDLCSINPSKKEIILKKLNDLQSLVFTADTNSQLLPSVVIEENTKHSFTMQQQQHSLRSFEQFLLSQQYYRSHSPDTTTTRQQQYYNSHTHHHSPSSSNITTPTHQQASSSSSPLTSASPSVVSNRRMGFGKESHLLNPEPSMNNLQDNNYILLDKFIKKRRTE